MVHTGALTNRLELAPAKGRAAELERARSHFPTPKNIRMLRWWTSSMLITWCIRGREGSTGEVDRGR